MKMNRISLLGIMFAVMLELTVGCSNLSLPPILPGAPTQPANPQLPSPSPKVAIAVATPTLVLAFGELDEVEQSLTGFLQAVSVGDVDKAMTYWSLYQPGQATDFAAKMRTIVTGWANGKHQFAIGAIAYSGLVAPGDQRTMPRDDPRVSHATVTVRIDGSDYRLALVQDKTGWLIEGIAASAAVQATATPH
jgi:hypothetical protein